MEPINRRLYNPVKVKPSFIDATLIHDEESNFSFKDIFKKKESSDSGNDNSSNDNSRSVKEKSGVGLGIFSGLLGVVGSLAPLLPSLGIGSKARIAETKANAAANKSNTQLLMESADQEADNLTKLILIGGVMVFLVVIVAVTLRK